MHLEFCRYPKAVPLVSLNTHRVPQLRLTPSATRAKADVTSHRLCKILSSGTGVMGGHLKVSSAQCIKVLRRALAFCARATTKPLPDTNCAPKDPLALCMIVNATPCTPNQHSTKGNSETHTRCSQTFPKLASIR